MDKPGRQADPWFSKSNEVLELRMAAMPKDIARMHPKRQIALSFSALRISFVLPLVSLASCITMQIPVSASDEPASEIINSRISQMPVAYSFDDSVISVTGFAHIQDLTLQISPGPAIVRTISNSIMAVYPNATVYSGLENRRMSNYRIYFTLDSFQPDFTYTRSFLDLNDTIQSNVSIGISVRIVNAKGEDVYRGIIYGVASKDEQSDTSRAKDQLSRTTNAAIQMLGDDFVQKVLSSQDILNRMSGKS